MSEKKNNEDTTMRNTNYLGRMTDEEYNAMWDGGDNIIRRKVRNMRSLGRLTEEEYRNLPYGNKGFYKQFTK